LSLKGLNKRLDVIEGALSASERCVTCHGSGVHQVTAIPTDGSPGPPHRPCPECGRLSYRQHVIAGVSQADVDALFQPAPPNAVPLSPGDTDVTLHQIDRRLAAIAAVLANEPRTCPTCEGWSSLLMRFEDADGTIRTNTADGWPVDATCPGCGRRCEQVITFGVDERGPA
jgi:hypothetical protein